MMAVKQTVKKNKIIFNNLSNFYLINKKNYN